MIHAGAFTHLMLLHLDGLLVLGPDCLMDIITPVPSTNMYEEQKYNLTTDEIRRINQTARQHAVSYANTEDLEDMERVVASVEQVISLLPKLPQECAISSSDLQKMKEGYMAAARELQVLVDTARTTRNIIWYYMPPVITIVFICGMVGNCVLLLIFIKHPETRSGPKVMLVNLVVSDILLLLFNFFAKYYFRLRPFTLGYTACCIYTFLICVPCPVSVISMTVLSITRYIAVTALPGDRAHKVLDHMSSIVAVVWVVASLETLHVALESEITSFPFSTQTHCDIINTVESVYVMVILHCFVPFVIIGIFSYITYRRLCRSGAKKTSAKTKLDEAKDRNAKILPALIILYGVTYPPLFIFWFIATIHRFHLSPTLVWFYYMTQSLLTFNSALNPIVLYLSSGMFREFFNRYLFLWRINKQQLPATTDDDVAPATTS